MFVIIFVTALLKWRKNSQKLHGLLNKVSSCHLYSKNLRKYWLNFFRKRQGTFFTSVATFDQSWSSGRGIIRAKSSSLPWVEIIILFINIYNINMPDFPSFTLLFYIFCWGKLRVKFFLAKSIIKKQRLWKGALLV